MYYMNITFWLQVFWIGGKWHRESSKSPCQTGGVSLRHKPEEMPMERGPVHIKERTLFKAAVRSLAPSRKLSMGSGAFDFWFGVTIEEWTEYISNLARWLQTLPKNCPFTQNLNMYFLVDCIIGFTLNQCSRSDCTLECLRELFPRKKWPVPDFNWSEVRLRNFLKAFWVILMCKPGLRTISLKTYNKDGNYCGYFFQANFMF